MGFNCGILGEKWKLPLLIPIWSSGSICSEIQLSREAVPRTWHPETACVMGVLGTMHELHLMKMEKYAGKIEKPVHDPYSCDAEILSG